MGIPAVDENKLADAMKVPLTNHDFRRSMARAAWQKVVANFDENAAIERIIYEI